MLFAIEIKANNMHRKTPKSWLIHDKFSKSNILFQKFSHRIPKGPFCSQMLKADSNRVHISPPEALFVIEV